MKYDVKGMTCAACSARVEKAVAGVLGVDSVQVNLLTNSMNVEGNAQPQDIIYAVEKAGYEASLPGEKVQNKKETRNNKMLTRLISSLVVWLILMYFSMGHMMFGWPLPTFLEGNHVAMGLLQLLLTVIIMVINQKYFISGTKALINKAPNMDTLVALGAAASFAWSVYALFAMTSAVMYANETLVMKYMDEFYFESAATILTLITVGKTLEEFSKGKTKNALDALLKLSPERATIVRDGKEMIVDVSDVIVGDIFLVRPGESIPVDGVVVEGESAVNEAALTGESVLVDKAIGDKVSTATVNTSGFLKCRATRVGEDTALANIIKMVSDASATKAPIARIADKVAAVFVPTVLGISALTFIIWLLTGSEITFVLERAISVLVISCPCALGLATPVAIMVGNGVGARNGILFKNATALENATKSQIVVFDKTGTITEGTPKVTDVIPASGVDEAELIKLAAALESKSEHPLGKAIVEYAKNKEIKEVSDFTTYTGSGLGATLDSKEIKGGSVKFMNEFATDYKDQIDELSKEGKTPMLFAYNGKCIGLIAVADTMKEDAVSAVSCLKKMGLRVVMLTGDNKRTAQAIGAQAGIDEVIAEVLPDEKMENVKRLMKTGKLIMVGDGINDAPALMTADVGIAIGSGTDVAVDAADIVLMKNKLEDVVAAIRLSRGTLTNIKQNLFWAFIYNIIGIPLAAGVLYPFFGLTLNPMFAAAAMSLSSFCVVMNALRLNLINIYNKKSDRIVKTKEEFRMTKTINIEGMMCPHCEANVKEALEALDGVSTAVCSHEKKTAELTLDKEVSDETLKATVESKGYTVISID